ncbi:MAG: hypothetical protein RL333_1783 [Pseudomonadota bacterium]
MPREIQLNKIQSAGVFLIHLYALSAWLHPTLNHLAFIGLAYLGLTDRPTRDWLIQKPVVRYSVGIAASILALSLLGIFEFNEQLANQALSTSKWILLSGFVFLLPWIANQRVKPENLFGLTLIGLLLGMMMNTSPWEILRFNIGSDHTNWQPHFQFSTAGMAGLSGGLCLAGLVMYIDCFFECAKRQRWVRGVFWFCAVYLAGYMFIASQSRISWLALLITLPTGMFVRRIYTKQKYSEKAFAKPIFLIVCVVSVIALGAWKNSALFKERMTRDIEIFSVQKSEQFEGSSFGLRLKMLEFGLQSIRQHPLLGWGNQGTASIARKTGDLRFRSPEPDGRLIWFPHLHNTYLEILLRYGLVGFFLFISALLASLLRLKRSISDQHDPRTLNALVFTGMGIVFFATCGLAGFQIMQEEWRAPFSLLFALAFAGRFRIRAESPEPASTSAIR